MTAELDVEQLQTTKSEKLLALVLAAFLLVGGIWAYQELDDYVRRALPLREPTAAEQQAIARCEGCGNVVRAPCPHCSARRRVGTQFCGACGQA